MIGAIREVVARFRVAADVGPAQRLGAALDRARGKAAQLGEKLSSIPGPIGALASQVSGLATGLRSAISAMTGLSGAAATLVGLGAIAAVAAGGIAAAAMSAAQMGDELHKAALRTGVAADALQRWRHAAGLGGAAAADVEMAFKALSKKMVEVERGSGPAADAFRSWGIETRNADGSMRALPDVLRDVGAGLRSMTSDSERLATAQILLEESGAKLLPTLTQTSESLDASLAEIDALGGGMSGEFVQASADAIDASARMGLAFTSLRSAVLVNVLPAVTWLVNGAAYAIGAFTTWAREIGVLRTIVITLGVVLGAFVATALAALAPLLVAAAYVAAPWIAIGLAVEDLIVFLAGGESVIGDFIDAVFGAGSAKAVVESIHAAFWAVVAAAKAAGLWIASLVPHVRHAAREALRWISWALRGAGIVLEWLWGRISALVSWIASWVGPTISRVFTAAWHAVRVAAETVIAWLPGAWEAAVRAVAASVQWLVDTLSAAWSVVTETAQAAADAILGAFAAVSDMIGGAFMAAVEVISDAFVYLRRLLMEGTADVLDTVASVAGSLGVKVGVDLGDLARQLRETGTISEVRSDMTGASVAGVGRGLGAALAGATTGDVGDGSGGGSGAVAVQQTIGTVTIQTGADPAAIPHALRGLGADVGHQLTEVPR